MATPNRKLTAFEDFSWSPREWRPTHFAARMRGPIIANAFWQGLRLLNPDARFCRLRRAFTTPDHVPTSTENRAQPRGRSDAQLIPR
jgi:hypothetical protein